MNNNIGAVALVVCTFEFSHHRREDFGMVDWCVCGIVRPNGMSNGSGDLSYGVVTNVEASVCCPWRDLE